LNLRADYVLVFVQILCDLKDWLDEHPQRGNPNAMLFPSMSDKNFGRKMMDSIAIRLVYRKYKLNYFPKLLENPNVVPEDKIKIKDLLKKPWNPYMQSALNT
jgi:hypothetical protein